MTKIKTKKSNTNSKHRLPIYRRAWFLAIAAIVVIAAIVCLILCLVRPGKQDSAKTPDDSTSQGTETPNSKPNQPDDTDIQNPTQSDEPYSDPDQVTVQYEGENPNRSDELSGSITYTDYTNGILSVGTMINQYLDGGICELELIGNTGTVYTTSSDIFAAASTSACRNLSINVVPDNYQIKITLISDDKQGIITGEVSL